MYVEFCAGTKRFIVRETETWNMSICREWNGLFSDFNPIFLFDRRLKTLPLHWYWLCLCLWQWIVSSFPWEIFNRKHADRFYGFLSYSFHSNQKTLRTNKSAFTIICEGFSAAIYNVNFASDMLSIVCCMHSFESVSSSIFGFVDRTNWERFKTMTKTNERNWNKANEQTNWFESLDQPQSENNTIKNIHQLHTRNPSVLPKLRITVCVPFEYFPILISLILTVIA